MSTRLLSRCQEVFGPRCEVELHRPVLRSDTACLDHGLLASQKVLEGAIVSKVARLGYIDLSLPENLSPECEVEKLVESIDQHGGFFTV